MLQHNPSWLALTTLANYKINRSLFCQASYLFPPQHQVIFFVVERKNRPKFQETLKIFLIYSLLATSQVVAVHKNCYRCWRAYKIKSKLFVISTTSANLHSSVNGYYLKSLHQCSRGGFALFIWIQLTSCTVDRSHRGMVGGILLCWLERDQVKSSHAGF